MSTLMDAFADEQSILDSLPGRDFDALGLGDGLGIVYDSVHGKKPQVVKGVVIGGKGDDLFVLEPHEETPKSTWDRRVFTLDRDTVKRATAKDMVRDGADFGHRPYLKAFEGAERPDDRDETWPVETTLGEVLKVVDMDVDASRQSRAWGEFRLPRYGGRGGFNVHRSEFGSVSAALCDRLFEATGGAHVYDAHTFEVPSDQYGRYSPRFVRALRWLDGETPSDPRRRQPKVDF